MLSTWTGHGELTVEVNSSWKHSEPMDAALSHATTLLLNGFSYVRLLCFIQCSRLSSLHVSKCNNKKLKFNVVEVEHCARVQTSTKNIKFLNNLGYSEKRKQAVQPSCPLCYSERLCSWVLALFYNVTDTHILPFFSLLMLLSNFAEYWCFQFCCLLLILSKLHLFPLIRFYL